MSTQITIKHVDGTDLYQRYHRQSEAQDACIWLDCKTRRLWAAVDPTIGNAQSTAVWLGHTRQWSIPRLRADAANALLAKLAPLAQAVCDGYDTNWNGENTVATFSTKAKKALQAIDAACADVSDEDALEVWSAEEWYEPVKNVANELGITADTTDDELREIASRELERARSEGTDAIDGLDGFLAQIRDELRDA